MKDEPVVAEVATEPVVAPPEPPAEPSAHAVPGDAVGPKKGKRGKLIALGAIGAVLLLIGGVFLYLIVPASGQDFDDPVDAETRSINTALYATLLAAGIEDPFVDVNGERAYVVYVVPNATVVNATQGAFYQRFVIGAAADAAPNVDTIHVLQYVREDPVALWTVAMADVLAYVRGELDAAGFDGRIQKTAF